MAGTVTFNVPLWVVMAFMAFVFLVVPLGVVVAIFVALAARARAGVGPEPMEPRPLIWRVLHPDTSAMRRSSFFAYTTTMAAVGFGLGWVLLGGLGYAVVIALAGVGSAAVGRAGWAVVGPPGTTRRWRGRRRTS